MKITQTFTAPNRATWREWLTGHGASESEIWLVYYKAGAGKATITYEDSLEEALCFGWVDSLIQKINEQEYARKFTPRKPGSKWSELNKHLVTKLIKEGRMTEAGLAKVEFSTGRGTIGPAKTARPAPAGLVEGGPDDQPAGLGELQQAAALAPAELHPMGLGCQAGGDTPEADKGSDRAVGEE
jgi:hypothetical protein